MPPQALPARIPLAELLAALSVGIDLSFGQPMEHVLRQCLIALRLAERRGLDHPTRAAIYFTALLVNVGCHSDAHVQARWFGDDIALKVAKYRHGMRARGGRVDEDAGRGPAPAASISTRARVHDRGPSPDGHRG